MRCWTAILLCFLSGCTLQERAQNPFPGVFRVAIAPVNDKSHGALGVNTQRIWQTFASELQKIPDLEVVPPQEVTEVLGPKKIETNQPAMAYALARAVHAQAVFVVDVTDYESYYPPRLGLHCEMYSMVTGQPEAVIQEPPLAPAPPLWYHKKKKWWWWIFPRPIFPLSIFPRLIFPRPTETYEEYSEPLESYEEYSEPTESYEEYSEPTESYGHHKKKKWWWWIFPRPIFPRPTETYEEYSEPTESYEEYQEPYDCQECQLGQEIIQASAILFQDRSSEPYNRVASWEGIVENQSDESRAFPPNVPVSQDEPQDLNEPYEDELQSPQLEVTSLREGRIPAHLITIKDLADPVPVVEPWVVRHSRVFEGNNRGLVSKLSDYRFFKNDRRGGAHFGYLERVDDFERFCCNRMIYEMLESAGGEWTPLRGLLFPKPWEPWPWR